MNTFCMQASSKKTIAYLEIEKLAAYKNYMVVAEEPIEVLCLQLWQ